PRALDGGQRLLRRGVVGPAAGGGPLEDPRAAEGLAEERPRAPLLVGDDAHDGDAGGGGGAKVADEGVGHQFSVVTRRTSSKLVTPLASFLMAASRRVMRPSWRACFRISLALDLATMSFRILSSTSRTSKTPVRPRRPVDRH